MSTIKPREAEVVIYQGDDLPRLTELRQAAEVARRRVAEAAKSPLRVGDEAGSSEAEEQAYNDFLEQAAERALLVKVRAIGRRRFRALMADHPPRSGEDGKVLEEDALYEVNTETFPEALLAFRDGEVATVVEPEFATSAAVRAFCDDELADGDFEELWLAAYWLNRSPSADPKASAY